MFCMCASHASFSDGLPLFLTRQPIIDFLLQIGNVAKADKFLTVVEQLAQARLPVHHLESTCTCGLKTTYIHSPCFAIVQIIDDNLGAAKRAHFFLVVDTAPLMHTLDLAGRHPQRGWVAP